MKIKEDVLEAINAYYNNKIIEIDYMPNIIFDISNTSLGPFIYFYLREKALISSGYTEKEWRILFEIRTTKQSIADILEILEDEI